jgi:hypothetical protein
MTYIPKVKFVDSLEKHASLICFNAKSICKGLYQKGGFSILPHLPCGHYRSVYFPDLDISSKFWKSISTIAPDYGGKFRRSLSKEIEDQLKLYKWPADFGERKQKIIEGWNKIESDFFNDIETFLSHSKNDLCKIKEIEVLITPFGTAGSYMVYNDGNGEFRLTLSCRMDMDEGNIARIILNGLYKIGHDRSEIGEISWYERMGTVEYLMNYAVFSKYWKSVMISDEKLIKYSRDSEIYLVKLGFPNDTQIRVLDTNDIVINGEMNNGLFTAQEKGVLIEMLINRNKIYSYDEIADILWEDDSDAKFSLYAIAKVIENIRRKLKYQGLQGNLIKTVRGKGYYYRG